jgi:hypothetical protein
MMPRIRDERIIITPRGLFAQRKLENEVSLEVAEDGNDEFRKKRRLSERNRV